MQTVLASGFQGGRSAAEAARWLADVGPNVVPAPARAPVWLVLAQQLTHVFALLLWVAAALAVVAGMPRLGVAIVIVVVVNGVFAFVQEYRADKATERLRDMMPVTARVRRDGHPITADVVELVPDDVVLLEDGDRAGADLRIAVVHGLAVDESMLTGGSVPRHPSEDEDLYAGTYVVEGAATAVVIRTGGRTRMAGIAALTGRAVPPLPTRLDRVVKVIGATAVAVGVVFFGLSLALGAEPVAGFLLAIGVTVALYVKGAPESVLARCADADPHAAQVARDLAASGLRVLAVAAVHRWPGCSAGRCRRRPGGRSCCSPSPP